jgi:hypothetical protein
MRGWVAIAVIVTVLLGVDIFAYDGRYSDELWLYAQQQGRNLSSYLSQLTREYLP